MEKSKGIESLSEEDKSRFDKRLMDNLYDRYWCKGKGIDYVDPNIKEAKEKTYQEMFE
ncbi:MAG: hypothetical protein KKF50_01840 [Nanoarchaeota archaeon]|nr:hypothetical protein [Nanoarchaeota archaeon]